MKIKEMISLWIKAHLRKEEPICSFKVNDKVIFNPEGRTESYLGFDFQRLGLYPGKIMTIGKIQNGKVKLSDKLSLGCEHFMRFDEDEKCIFEIGDIVRFTPSDRTVSRYKDYLEFHEPKIGKEYPIIKILNGIWVFTHENPGPGFYWKDYTLVNKKMP